MKTLWEFLAWERASHDTIDVKRMYIDVAGDLMAGVLLSQVVYWYLPDKCGNSKLSIEREGYLWLAKAREEWWGECRITPRQADRLLPLLESKGIIETRNWKFDGSPTTHIRIIWDVLLPLLDEIVANPPPNPYESEAKKRSHQTVRTISPQSDTQELGSHQTVRTISPSTLIGSHETVRTMSPNREMDVPESGKLVTETTTKTTPKTTTKTTTKTDAPPQAATKPKADVVVSLASTHKDGTPSKEAIPKALAAKAVEGFTGISETTGAITAAQAEQEQARAALVEKGVDRAVAARLVERHGPRQCLEQIAALPYRKYDEAAPFLVAALDRETPYSLPTALLDARKDAARRAEQQAIEKERVQRQRDAAESARVERDCHEERWQALTPEQREQIECQARAEIAAKPMGMKWLDTKMGKEDVRLRCLKLMAHVAIITHTGTTITTLLKAA